MHRLTELDALRGVAAAMVVIYHYTSMVRGPSWTTIPVLHWLWPFKAGSYGVAVFFVISGFVISMTLERARSAMDFVVSRVGRLYPAYWAGVLLSSAIRASSPTGRPTLTEVLVNLTMFEEWFRIPFIDGVYWTLTVELQFYILMLAISALGQVRRLEIICLCWIAFAGAVGFSGRVGVPAQVKDLLNQIFILPHAPQFAAGIMFYRIYQARVTRLRVGVILVALGAVFVGSEQAKAIVVAVTFGLFTLIVTNRLRIVGRNSVLLFLGAISYPLYLIHLGIGYRTTEILSSVTQNAALLLVAPILTSVALATAMHYWIEDPARESLRKWWKERKSPITPA